MLVHELKIFFSATLRENDVAFQIEASLKGYFNECLTKDSGDETAEGI